MRKYHINHDFFNIINSSEKSWLLGFVLANGSVFKHKSSYVLSFHIAKRDEEILLKINELMNSSYPIKIDNHNNSVLLGICSKKIYNDLNKLGIYPNKTYKYTKINYPIKFERDFFRGYFDGDGWIYVRKNKQLSFGVCGHLELLEKIKNILTKKCNLNNIKIHNRNNTFSYCVGGNKQTKRIYNYLYNNATIYLERKYKKWSDHIANVDG